MVTRFGTAPSCERRYETKPSDEQNLLDAREEHEPFSRDLWVAATELERFLLCPRHQLDLLLIERGP